MFLFTKLSRYILSFCKALKENGANVLGITETPTDYLPYELKVNLTDHYKVDSLHNFDQKCDAIRYFINKYGPIDYIESNNEYWLDDDARLREIFNVTTGPNPELIKTFNRKSLMKEGYKRANVKTARYLLVSTIDKAKDFINVVGYPVVVKPDHGVGASKTYKISDAAGLVTFFEHYDGSPYIMEEYLEGELLSFDGVCDSNGNVVYPTHHAFPTPIMDIVTGLKEVEYYTVRDIPDDLMKQGQAVLKAFGAKSRFYHLEFFRLTKDKPGLANKGELVGLEVNMRVPGGYTPDMIDYAYSIDIYKIWADVMCFDENREDISQVKRYCLYLGRRDGINYLHDDWEIFNRYCNLIMKEGRMPDIFSEAMGNRYYMFRVDDKATIAEIRRFVLARK